MKILHVSTSAQLGGAGIAAYRLHKGLRSLGADSWMLVNKKRQPENYILSPLSKVDKLMARVCSRLDPVPCYLTKPRREKISPAWVPNRLVGRINAESPDIVNMHWVNEGLMRIEALPKISRPIVWTLHDMWAFSGGEHYVGQSERYKEGYRASNRPAEEIGLDINRWVWARKKKSWAKISNMVIVTPSRWLSEAARASDLFRNYRIEVLPNGVDHQRFHPISRATARTILGLPEDKRIILFGSLTPTSDKRKGFHLLREALKELETSVNPNNYQLVVFGASSGEDSFAVNTHYLGRLQDEISMALAYAAADVFVAPSVEENLANTVLESLSCGTPAVAFDIGGMSDMISHKRNGYLVTGFDTKKLAKGIRWVLEDEQNWEILSRAARDTIVKEFTLERAAARYLDLYKDII